MRTNFQMWRDFYESKPPFNANLSRYADVKLQVARSATRSSNMLYDSRRARHIYTLDFILKHINFWLSQEDSTTPFNRRQREVDEL